MNVHRRSSPGLAIAGIAVSVLVSLEAAAQPQEATAIFEQAAADYMAKRYDVAAVGFRKAYAVLPEAVFLYNQARALQKLENWESAISALERARDQVERPLSAELAAKVPAMMQELEAARAASSSPLAAPPSDEPASGIFAVGWTGVGTLVAGAGMIVAGGVMASGVSDEAQRLRTTSGQTRTQFEADRQAALDKQSWARVLFYSGSGLALLGAGLLSWDLLATGAEEDSAKLLIAPSGVFVEVPW